jgi:hypothetical protein
MKKCLFAVCLLLGATTALALEFAGVTFDERVRVGPNEVVVNGAGMRKMAIFKVYAMALYLPEKQSEAAATLALKGAKRVAISLLRDVTAQQFVDGLREGIADNHTDAELSILRDWIDQLAQNMQTIGEAKTGTLIYLDWLPDSGTRLVVNGKTIGQDIPGDAFYKAILKIWLGHKPVQGDLKQALLGKLS